MSERERALSWEITKGAVKYLRKLDHIAQTYMKSSLARQKPTIVAALRIGFYQLTEMSGIPRFAAVDETVELLSRKNTPRDAGFVNAILRSFLREPEKVKYPKREKNPVKFLGLNYSYPDWLVKRWLDRFGFDETERILGANNKPAPISFRIIRSRASLEEISRTFEERKLSIRPDKYFGDYVIADNAPGIIKSDIFKRGWLTVQDESQGLPIKLLAPEKGSQVLDLCSAPGGKTIALADIVGPSGKIYSVDNDSERLDLVKENAVRTGMKNIEFVCEDALNISGDRKYKYILLDVPCSGLGTMRHNADIRWKKKAREIPAFSRLQRRMLARAAEYLDNGGKLVYSTCTTEPEEIEQVVLDFIAQNGHFRLARGNDYMLSQFETENGFYRTFPHKHGIGGGGFACLQQVDS
jgi:16S rRNA (cytosine967-C5)-methyltransferase